MILGGGGGGGFGSSGRHRLVVRESGGLFGGSGVNKRTLKALPKVVGSLPQGSKGSFIVWEVVGFGCFLKLLVTRVIAIITTGTAMIMVFIVYGCRLPF